MQTINLSSLPERQRYIASKAIWGEIAKQDAQDRRRLEALLPKTGWFTVPDYGKEASDATWSVVQHQTDDPAFMASMLARMAEPARLHEIDPSNYALLFDRVAMLQHRLQYYGSQFTCVNHRWTLYAIDDVSKIDNRRRKLGFEVTEAQTQKRLASYPPCFFGPHK